MGINLITRQIGIDAGHRIPNHLSKCRNIHGHRYQIYVTISGEIEREGSEQGMAGGMDFSFLKEEMMDKIDKYCDHCLILWIDDPLLDHLVDRTNPDNLIYVSPTQLIYNSQISGRICVINYVPTAENLARHWYDELEKSIFQRSYGKATLAGIRVDETPNCSAHYSK